MKQRSQNITGKDEPTEEYQDFLSGTVLNVMPCLGRYSSIVLS